MKHVIEHSMPHRASSRHLKWLTILLVGIILLMSCIATFWVPLITKTLIWSIIYYYWTALGIAAGYHRLWAHNAYKATPILKIFLAGVGGGAAEGSILGWCQNHRIHHRYANTEKDPYVSEKSLLYSHLSWTITKENPKRIGYVDISDLNDDPIVALQHFHYVKVVLFMGLVFPTVVSGLGWGDWCGGLIYAGILRIFFQQATSCACSLTHWLGEQSFNGRNSSRDHAITALLSLGEGYDNFHHEFPSDYRNAIGRFQCDPTKWYIRMWKQLGLAYDLKQFTAHEIEKSYIQQAQKNLDQKRASLDWGIPITQLPVLEWNNYVEQCNNGRSLIAIAGVVHDVVDFIQDHPGGKAIIKAGIGKDATGMFSGVDYDHSNAAHNVLSLMRVGIIGGDRGFEVWKLVGCADNAMQAPMISPGVA